MTRDEIRDEIWDAMMNRMDIDVSTTDLADAALERLERLGIIASCDTRPEGGDATEIAAPFTGGAVGEAETPKGQP